MRITCLVLACVLGVSALSIKKEEAPETELKQVSNIAETEDFASGRPVFYLIVMGKYAYRHQVSIWLSSLRKTGNWRGEAVVVTDQPKCLQMTLKEAGLIGQQLKSTEGVDIYAPAPGYAGNLHVIKRPHTGDINKMKLEKARAWLNIKNAQIPHRVTSIIYTDEDVVIGKDLTAFASEVKALEAQKHTLALFRDTGASAGELHTGVVVMFPGQHTDQCLQSWAKHLTGINIGTPEFPALPTAKNAKFNNANVTEDAIEEDASRIKEGELLAEEIAAMGPDQQALGRTKQCKKATDHEGIKILPGRFFWLPTQAGMSANKRAEFVHFTNTGRWKIISHSAIKKYLYRIGVPQSIDPMGHVQSAQCQGM
jgi:hypothetical protein